MYARVYMCVCLPFVGCCYGSSEVKAQQSSCPTGDVAGGWKLSKYACWGSYWHTCHRKSSCSHLQEVPLCCLCLCFGEVRSEGNTGLHMGSAGMQVRQWQWDKSATMLWCVMFLHVCKCFYRNVIKYTCGHNIPHLDDFLCVLLRGCSQVGGSVFENDYLCI